MYLIKIIIIFSLQAVLDRHIKSQCPNKEISREQKELRERKKRKDLGSVKGSLAVKLTGIPICNGSANITPDMTVVT